MAVPAAQGDQTPALTALEFAALAFLSVPLLLFLATFASYPIAALGLPVMAVALWRARPHGPWLPAGTVTRMLLCLALAGVYLWACAYLAPTTRAPDWGKHYAITNELAVHDWPPVDATNQTYLRFYLGYYLVAGLAAKLFGVANGYLCLFAVTWIGLALALGLALDGRKPRRPLVFLVVLLMFSGPDILLHSLSRGSVYWFSHKEWWAGDGGYSYQGFASHFIWAPQHILPALLAVFLVLRDGARPLPPHIVVPLFCMLVFWSPFVALGLAPIAAAATRGSWGRILLDPGNIACGAAVGLPVIAYLLSGATDIPKGINWKAVSEGPWLYGAFAIGEFGALAIALRVCGRQPRHALVAVASLMILPLFSIGMYNDLVMRASLPALIVLAIAASAAVTEVRGLRAVPLAMLVGLGVVSSAFEIAGVSRRIDFRPEEASLRSGVFAERHDIRVQYNAPLPHWTIRHAPRDKAGSTQ